MDVLLKETIIKANTGDYILGRFAEELIVYYRGKSHKLFDNKSIMIALSIFIVSLLFLSRGIFVERSFLKMKRGRHQTVKTSEDKTTVHGEIGEEMINSGRIITTNSSNNTFLPSVAEVETGEEHFEKIWPAIRISCYRELVLPPECKLVDLSAFLRKRKNEEKPSNKREKLDFVEHPLNRVMTCCKRSFSLLNEGLRLIFFCIKFMILRLSQRCTSKNYDQLDVETEDEAEDKTVEVIPADEKLQESIFYTPTKERDDVWSPSRGNRKESVSNNKKSIPTSKLKRQNSSDRFYETVFDDENDVGEQPLIDALDLSWGSTGPRRNRNLLEQYRSQNSSPLHDLSIPPVSQTIELNCSREIICKEVHPAGNRADSESMSFFDAAHSTASLRKLHVEVPVPDRNGYILGDDFLVSSRQTPVLVFVNSRSGPRQGRVLIGQLRRLLNPIQVWDLADGGPETVLESFCAFTRLRVLVCGGDGTVSWVISCLERLKPKRWPPIAILPLGTGNDLARIHGWGGGYNNESLISILEQVAESYISLLDQWEIKIENRKGKVIKAKSFFNYAGFGADAQAALQVHMLRESKPELFFSRLFNKVWYLIFGAEEAIKESNINLPNEIVLVADGLRVPLPPDSQGILFLNIDSYLGGIPIWSLAVKEKDHMSQTFNGQQVESQNLSHTNRKELDEYASRSHSTGLLHDVFFDRVESCEEQPTATTIENDKYNQLFSCSRPSSCQDGKLDIISIRGTFHLGQIQVGLGHGLRLCQASKVEVITKKKLAVQIDGEPWLQSECRMKITRKKDAAVMLHRSSDKSRGVETEVAELLEWAENRKVIDSNVHAVLMKEFSRRIEDKSRQRRVKSQDNLMLSIRRAIGGKALGINSTFPGSLSY